MLLKLKAKVSLFNSEEQMEANSAYDLGNVANAKYWAWRDMAIPVETVTKIVAFNAAKSLVYNIENEEILVWEKFDKVYNKWRIALYEYNNTVDTKPVESPTEEDPVIGGEDEEDEEE